MTHKFWFEHNIHQARYTNAQSSEEVFEKREKLEQRRPGDNQRDQRFANFEKILVNAFTHGIYFDGSQQSNEQIPY